MKEGYEEIMEMDITATELFPETDTGDATETGADNDTTEGENGDLEGDDGELEGNDGELEEGGAETAAPLPEVVPEDTVVSPELPSVSANDLPSLLPALPVESPQETDSTEDLPADFTASIAELLENAQNFDELLAVVRELSETVSVQTDADTAYYTEMILLQEQHAALLQDAYALLLRNEALQKYMLASNIAVGFVLILTFGYIVAHGFFQRMKVG